MIGNTSKTDQRVLNAQKVIGLLAITAISEVSDSVITAPNRFRGRGEEGRVQEIVHVPRSFSS